MTTIEYIGGPMDGATEQMPDDIEFVLVKQPLIRVLPGGISETRNLIHRYERSGDRVAGRVLFNHKSISVEAET